MPFVQYFELPADLYTLRKVPTSPVMLRMVKVEVRIKNNDCKDRDCQEKGKESNGEMKKKQD